MTVVEEITLQVPGMSCGHCEHAVRSEVSKVAGVESVTVDLGTKDVVVRGAGLVTADVVGAVAEAGYAVTSAH
ncbi:MAG: heavy-metal-associated domain-containing protein [Ilumatobacteraceae bacterium]